MAVPSHWNMSDTSRPYNIPPASIGSCSLCGVDLYTPKLEWLGTNAYTEHTEQLCLIHAIRRLSELLKKAMPAKGPMTFKGQPIVWNDPEATEALIAGPGSYCPGCKMIYPNRSPKSLCQCGAKMIYLRHGDIYRVVIVL